MSCSRARRDLLKALVDDLPPRRRQALGEHLAGCASYREEAREAGILWREMEEIPAPDPGPLYWEAFASRVRRRIEDLRDHPDQGREALPADPRQEMGCRAAVAAALLAAVALGLTGHRAAPRPDAAAALVKAVLAPGAVARVAPAALEVEDPGLEIEETLAGLSREEASRLREGLQRELGTSPAPRKESVDGC